MTWLSGKDEKKSFSISDDTSDGDSVSVTSAATTPFTRNDILVCATRGKIYAIHKHNGQRIWSADFPSGSTSIFSSGSMGGIISIFITDQDKVIVASSGKTACLNLLNGEPIWVNKMKSFGYEEVGIICTPSRILSPQRVDPSEMHDSPPGYHESGNVLVRQPVVISCSYGKCMGIDLDTGEELWRFNCPKGGYTIPSALVDPEGGSTTVFVGCGRRVYCLDAHTGDLRWESKISGKAIGQGYLTFATPWSSRLAAEAHTAFSQFPMAQAAAEARKKHSSGGGGGGGGGGG